MGKRARWVWQSDVNVKNAFLDDCLSVLEGGDTPITRAHVAACADWALRATADAERLARYLAQVQVAIARANDIAEDAASNVFALSAGEQP